MKLFTIKIIVHQMCTIKKEPFYNLKAINQGKLDLAV